MDGTTGLVLASASNARRRLLDAAGVPCSLDAPRIDEHAIRASMIAAGEAAPRIAEVLAEAKALKVSARHPRRITVGADQILHCDGQILAKAASIEEARDQLGFLAGRTHELLSAAVAAIDGRPVWRHTGRASLTMHFLTADEIDGYLARAWERVRGAVGNYHIEEDGARLFSRITGDPFVIQGLPLVELLTWLRLRGDITP